VITALIDTVCAKLAEEDRLRTNRSEIRSIEATLRALEQIAISARDLSAALDVCEPYLGQQTVLPVRAQADVVARDLDASRQRFATNRKEQLALHTVGTKLQRASADLAERWKRYAQARQAPYLDLFQLVTYLPEVAARAPEINQLVVQMQGQAARPPRTQAQFDQFDERLADLGRRLDAVARLPAEVRAFLGSVVGGTATLADLTPEVQAWIVEGERATAFSISFAQRRG
jgi:hypothetical protein